MLVEDDTAVAAAMLLLLRGAGFSAVHAPDGATAQRLKREILPNIAVVDIQLPDTSGVSLMRWLVEEGGCGILMLSGLNGEADRVICLQLGADDYIVKPPNPRELIARILAVHRRRAPRAARTLRLGGLTVDLDARTVSGAEGQTQDLTTAECALLAALNAAKGRSASRDWLSRAVLHRPWRVNDRSIDQLVFQLRRKLGMRVIQSVRGEGYCLTNPEET